MDIIQYFESVRRAFQEDDTDRVKELMEEFGGAPVDMKEVERLVYYVFQTMAQFQVALEEKTQIQFDLIVNSLEDEDILSAKGLQNLRQADNELNRRLEEGQDSEEK